MISAGDTAISNYIFPIRKVSR